MATVSLNNISLTYPGGAAGLADIDLQLGDGEFVALIGPSGSGKTTLLRTVAGFLTPTAGSISIADRTVAGETTADAATGKRGHTAWVPPEQRGLGMVFQQHAVWPHWNVGRNIAYPLRRAGVSRAECAKRVAEVLELVGLSGAEKRSPATLSGGQRQRVAIARAIVARPQVLLLDEALSALDEPLRDRLRLELRSLTKELGLTVLHVTHDRSEALALADRVAVLEGGRLQQCDTPAALLARPATPFVAGFLADAAIMQGTVQNGLFVVQADTADAAAHATTTHTAARGELCFRPTGHTVIGDTTNSSYRAEIAIMPEHVNVTPDPHGDATVETSMFGRAGDELVIRWGGFTLRSRVPGLRCQAGERVRVQIQNALVYPLQTEDMTEIRDVAALAQHPAGRGARAATATPATVGA